MFGDDYILQIAQETQNVVVAGLNDYLVARLLPKVGAELADDLATAVFLSVLDWPTKDLLPAGFIEQHAERIDAEAKELAKDERLREVLSGAVYNIGYGHYIKAGGGRFINRYLSFFRLERRTWAGSRRSLDAYAEAQSKLHRMDSAILRPYRSLLKLGIWIERPDNPNEQDYYAAVCNFAKEAASRRQSQRLVHPANSSTAKPLTSTMSTGQPAQEREAERASEGKRKGEVDDSKTPDTSKNTASEWTEVPASSYTRKPPLDSQGRPLTVLRYVRLANGLVAAVCEPEKETMIVSRVPSADGSKTPNKESASGETRRVGDVGTGEPANDDYPTKDMIQEALEALKQGPGALEAVLERRAREQREAKNARQVSGHGVPEPAERESEPVETWCEICDEMRPTVRMELVEACAECMAREKTEHCEECGKVCDFDALLQLTKYGWTCAECVESHLAFRKTRQKQ